MAAFAYQALLIDGKKSRGVIEADSERAVRQKIREQGMTPLTVSPTASKNNVDAAGFSRWLQPKLSVSELAETTRQLATLVNASLPIDESLGVLTKSETNKRVSHIIAGLRSLVLEGQSLAAAMGSYTKSFSGLYRSSVSAGERSGQLGPVLERLADHMEHQDQSRKKVQLALTYPVILLVISLSMVSGLMIYVVPDVLEIFANNNHELPQLTQSLVAISDFLQSYGWTIPIITFAVGVGITSALRKDNIRFIWHRFLLHFLLTKKVSRSINASHYANTLSMLLGSGVSLTESMSIAYHTVNNDFFKDRLASAHQRVNEGHSLQESLSDIKLFPPIMLYMIGSGETSGRLSEMLERTATQQSRNLENTISTVLSLLEPLMLLLMGGLVLLIVMAILLPILNINQLVG